MGRKPRPERNPEVEAEPWQYKQLAFFGLKVEFIHRRTAFDVVKRLEAGYTREEVVGLLGWKEWFAEAPRWYHVRDMRELGIDPKRADSPREAQLLIGAAEDPERLHKAMLRRIDAAETNRLLDAVRRDLVLVRGILPERFFDYVAQAGKEKRATMHKNDDEIGD